MFNHVSEFERRIADFFGSPYAVAVDCCTHGIELCLRYKNFNSIAIPTNTYISVPFTADKLNIEWKWKDDKWFDYYFIGGTNIIDAAVLWKPNSYIENTYMCLSFQYKKHLSLGRGGAILLQDKNEYDIIKRMSYDGRDLHKPWKEQNISSIGYHYYMTPETAEIGLEKLPKAILEEPKRWCYKDYPFLPSMRVFNERKS